MNRTDSLIELCKQNNSQAQKELYDMYAPRLFGICLRYAADSAEAEDILHESFYKILTKIDNFHGVGVFEGWMRKIVINTAIQYYHRNKRISQTTDIDNINENSHETVSNWEQEFTQEELMTAINTLPKGYKAVFNLFAVEGYKHAEIAKMLEIDGVTSRTQYLRAKKWLQEQLVQLSKIRKPKIETMEQLNHEKIA